MNGLFSHLLLSLTAQGCLWTLLLLALCIGGTLAMERARNRLEQPPAQNERPEPQPLYYLVEKREDQK